RRVAACAPWFANSTSVNTICSWSATVRAKRTANRRVGAVSLTTVYSGPRKLDCRLSYSRLHRQSKKGETDGRHAEDSLGGVQGPGGHGGAEGGQDDQRTGWPARGPPHRDTSL